MSVRFSRAVSMALLLAAVLALAYGRISPDVFGLTASVDFLVMIVLGGLGSIRGAVIGALFVSTLPRILDHYSGSLPLVGQAGSGDLQPSQAARLLYGLAIIAVLLYARGGLAALGRRLRPKPPDSDRPTEREPAKAGAPRRPAELKERST